MNPITEQTTLIELEVHARKRGVRVASVYFYDGMAHVSILGPEPIGASATAQTFSAALAAAFRGARRRLRDRRGADRAATSRGAGRVTATIHCSCGHLLRTFAEAIAHGRATESDADAHQIVDEHPTPEHYEQMPIESVQPFTMPAPEPAAIDPAPVAPKARSTDREGDLVTELCANFGYMFADTLPERDRTAMLCLYVHSLSDEEYANLGAWCRTRRGQTGEGADWLPFRAHGDFKSGPKATALRKVSRKMRPLSKKTPNQALTAETITDEQCRELRGHPTEVHARVLRNAAESRAGRKFNAARDKAFAFFGSTDVEQAARANAIARAEADRTKAVNAAVSRWRAACAKILNARAEVA